MELPEDFQKYWKKNKFASLNEETLLAVSGGVDSMVMAHLFLKSHIKFAIAHCNFQLRGKEAGLDEQLVKDWAEANGIKYYVTRFDTKEASATWKKGIQETARILRYEWLEMIRQTNNLQKIATAHHANDNAETLLINLFKGTGISGLHGIQKQNGNIIRPLLFASKEAIAAYAKENNIPFREDASNATNAYLRNAIRHTIIPEAEKLFPGLVQNLNAGIERFAETEVLYNKAIEAERKKLTEQRGRDVYIPVLKLQKREPLQTICYELLQPYGFASAQIPQVLQLLHSDTGHFISSATHRIIRNRDFLIITDIQPYATDLISIEGAPCTIETGNLKFSFSIEKKPAQIPAGTDVAYIDLNKIEFPLILRKWHTGDYFYPLGMNMKKKKLSRFFIDQKVPLHEKEHTWLLECGKRIAWVAGMRLDERFKVNDHTEQVLVVKSHKH